MIEVHLTDELGSFAQAWDDLVLVMPTPSPFLRSWWLAGTAICSTRFLLVVDQDELLGGFPIEIGSSYTRVAGNVLGPDHMDVVSQPGHSTVVAASLRKWFETKGPRVIAFGGVGEHSVLERAMPMGHTADLYAHAPYTTLPDTFEEYLKTHGAIRKSVRDSARRIRKMGQLEHRIVAAEDADCGLNELCRLHEQAWGARSGFLPSADRFSTAARTGLANGEMVLHELLVGDVVVASHVVFDLANRISYYQSGRLLAQEWRGAGSVLTAAIIEHACRSGRREFDFLRGDAPYKRLWAHDQRRLLHLRAGRGMLGRATTFVVVGAERSRRRLGRARRRAHQLVGRA